MNKNYKMKVGCIFTQKKADELIEYLNAKDNEIDELKDALVWCSGSNDFALDGKARIGWEKICLPLINNKLTDK